MIVVLCEDGITSQTQNPMIGPKPYVLVSTLIVCIVNIIVSLHHE
jgi:hypothetical protein